VENVDVDSLQRQLTERIEALDKQRKEQAEQFNKEVQERMQLAEAEHQQRLAEYQEAEKKREAKRLKEETEEQERVQEATKARIALENSLAAAEEARKEQEAKLQWLVSEISKQEFIEEQHRKAMQNPTAATVEESTTSTEINVEHPVAPLNTANPGEAVKGTDGNTPESPLMSDHLKQILRQATRS
jgi:hypothetical protein